VTRYQSAVGELAPAQCAVDALVDQVDPAIALAHRYLDLRILREERRQVRHQEMARQRALHLDA
jgi:hypothetical protein